MAVLAESIEALEREDEALAGKWRSLAVFPAPFGRPAAEAVGEFEDNELDRLLARSLVLYDAKEDRFRLHDLMRELAWEGLCEAERFQAGKRHSRHYLKVIGRANDAYWGGGEGVLRACGCSTASPSRSKRASPGRLSTRTRTTMPLP